MLTEICAEIRNYFCKDEDKILGDFAVSDGVLTPSVGLAENQYYRIVGSVFNDGVHAQSDALTDEGTFSGAVWKMRVPAGFLSLVEDIMAWQDKNGAVDSAAMSPYNSESFGGYSYTKSASAAKDNVTEVSWRSAFASRLNIYRKIRV